MTNATNAQGITLNALNYRSGDARDSTAFFGQDPAMNPHCGNCEGAWGAGYVVALSAKWWEPERAYRDWAKGRAKEGYTSHESGPFALGEAQIVEVEQDFYVATIIGQVLDYSKEAPIRYEALATGLGKACAWMQAKHGTVNIQAPRLGAGLAGGKWPKIEAILLRLVDTYGATVVVVDLPMGNPPSRPTRK